MEFEELQTIWHSQNDENLYTINEEVLYAQIQQKSKAVDHKLNIYEWVMFLGNLIIGIVLFVEVLSKNGQTYEYVLPLMYIAFSIGTVILRRVRQKKEIQFDLTIMGELNKAIWQIDYLIKRGRSMMIWYMLPLILVLTVTLILDSKLLFALGTMAIAIPVSYFGGRWEINKWYLPKKRELESLRTQLSEG
ncbi:MAG: hypothetical protein KDE48_13440 [Anaerolineales bacterium]|nr:hypothetical protein [Anaerolineales bacterium]